MASARSRYWRLRYGHWGRRRPQSDGYTLLIPVPGDLPVFLDLALAVCHGQSGLHRWATVVIPDLSTPEILRRVRQARPTWDGRLELLELPALDRLVLPRLRDPGRNHGAQLIAGTSKARTSHIVLHDADLFLLDSQVHDDLYRNASESGMDVVGVSGPWDPWYAARGAHLAATWELCGRVDWLRSFPPHRHIGHDDVVGGEAHTFDTTFWPQLHTAPGSIAVLTGAEDRIVHFNYVISTYRRFQRGAGMFHDNSFRLLLIRLFIDLFSRGPEDYRLPSLRGLAQGLGGESAGTPVFYLPSDGSSYRTMRSRLKTMLDGPWSDADTADRCRRLLEPFDARFGVQEVL